MTDKELIALAAEMRAKQKDYFLTCYSGYLKEAKALEKRFDDELERRKKVEYDKRNPGLFG